LQRLTVSANNIRTRQLTTKMEKEMLSRVWRMYRQEALGRLAMPAQGYNPEAGMTQDLTRTSLSGVAARI
jgi:hypothetical protein